MEIDIPALMIREFAYDVINIEKREYSFLKNNFYERYLEGETDYEIHYTDYHVTAKSKYESLERTFVFTEREFEDKKLNILVHG